MHGEKSVINPNHEDFVSSVPGSDEKYSIIGCPNPIKDHPSNFYYCADKSLSIALGQENTHERSIDLLPHQAAITFNLQLPIVQQVKAAESALLLWQKYRRSESTGQAKKIEYRRHLSKWPNYLRALDAAYAGEILEEIGAVLSAPSDVGVEDYIFEVGSEKLKRVGQKTYGAAKQVQFNFPY